MDNNTKATKEAFSMLLESFKEQGILASYEIEEIRAQDNLSFSILRLIYFWGKYRQKRKVRKYKTFKYETDNAPISAAELGEKLNELVLEGWVVLQVVPAYKRYAIITYKEE